MQKPLRGYGSSVRDGKWEDKKRELYLCCYKEKCTYIRYELLLTGGARRGTIHLGRQNGQQKMIVSFKHKGLKNFFLNGNTKGIQHAHAEKIRDILGRLDASGDIKDMNVPSFKLHPLEGDRKGTWSVTVRANWRITFTFSEGNAEVVDYEDYH